MAGGALQHAARMTLTGPDHIIHAIPYLLGFHPHDSIVLIWVLDGNIVLTQRYDRTTGVDVRLLQQAADRVDAKDVIICGFATSDAASACRQEVRSLVRQFDSVIDAIVVVDTHWWCARDVHDACPSDGHPIDESIADAVAVMFIAQGVQVLPDRCALEHEVAPDQEGQAVVADLLASGSSLENAVTMSAEQLWQAITRPVTPAPTTPRLAADTLRALGDGATRDQLLLVMVGSDLTSLTLAGDRLSAVLRMAPNASLPSIASVTAVARWLAGDGARAWACLDRAAAIDPEHGLTRVVSHALHVGLPPSSWRAALAASAVDSV